MDGISSKRSGSARGVTGSGEARSVPGRGRGVPGNARGAFGEGRSVPFDTEIDSHEGKRVSDEGKATFFGLEMAFSRREMTSGLKMDEDWSSDRMASEPLAPNVPPRAIAPSRRWSLGLMTGSFRPPPAQPKIGFFCVDAAWISRPSTPSVSLRAAAGRTLGRRRSGNRRDR